MENQNYLMVNKDTNIVDNVCVWDGNPDTWQPPEIYLMLVQATTPAMVWSGTLLIEVIGAGGVGFTWDGTKVITDQPQPEPVPADQQPATTGTQTV